MARRHSRHDGGGRPRWAVFSLAALAVLGAVVWMAPAVVVLTSLRDRPLEAVFAGIDGSVASGSARWNWLGGVEYRDVVFRDRTGRALAIVPEAVIDRGLVALAWNPRELGAVRLSHPELLLEVRRGGSSLEDMLAPWLAGFGAETVATPAFDLEIVDAIVELVDRERGDTWRVSDMIAAGTVRRDATLAGWSVAGRVRHAGRTGAALPPAGPPPSAAGGSAPAPPPGAAGERRLDRTTIAAKATAALARDGGWSVSSPGDGADGPRTVAIAAHRLPLGVSSVLATRLDMSHVVDGLGDIRLDLALPAAGPQAVGTLTVDQLAVCRADTLDEVVRIERCEMPFDLAFAEGRIVVRKFAAASPLFKAEASGRIRLPDTDSWQWAEELAAEDFAVAADIDLAAASRAMPGGLTLRSDVRVTDGRLQLAAASHADGVERVLEVRLSARDLAAVKSVAVPAEGNAAAAGVQERPLRWSEPFTAWLRGRRGGGRGSRLRVEEARITSAAVEVSAAGTAEEARLQWTLDLQRLVAEAEELFDLGGVSLAGTSRGRIEIGRPRPDSPSALTAAVAFSDVELSAPGRPTWRDKSIAIDAEATGSFAGGAATIEAARVAVSAADDTFEAALKGGVIVDVAALAGGHAGGPPWLRPGPTAQAPAADWSIAGDLGRWHARLAGLVPALATGFEPGGRLQAAAAITARGDTWQITRAGGEIEKFTLTCGDRRIAEPRIVATAAGLVHPATGRIDLSSAELLSTTVSLRTGGLSWQSVAGGDDPAAQDVASIGIGERLRGKLQWQADVGRLARWFLEPAVADRWPAAGRTWGTVELVDTQAGLNILLEATGSQLAVTHKPAASGRAGAEAPAVWSEPQATLVLELTRPIKQQPADRPIRIDRVAIASSTVAVAAKGGVGDRSAGRLLELDGTLSYDWQQVSRLLTPWTGGRLRCSGAGGRPFACRVPLSAAPHVADRPRETAVGPGVATVPLPDDWLAATRGRDPAAADRSARLAVPVAAPTQTARGTVDWIRGLAIDTSVAWQTADVAGFPFAAGEFPVRLVEGQLAFGPCELGVSGGRLRGAPWISLVGSPRELVVPAGRIVDRVALAGPQADAVVNWLSPLLGHATHTEGVVSVELAGARLPVDDPAAGDLTGEVIFERLDVMPNAGLEPLVNLLVKLQSVVDPRFAFGDKAVLLRVRPEPVRIRLAERRLWHEGLVMDSGQLVLRSHGSVGVDGTLAMVVEVALRGDLAGQTPVVAQLLRTPLVLPLKGTVERPQFDARSLDLILGRIVENTAQAVIGDSLGRGLETLFGNPQPPPASPAAPAAPAAPLILPPQPR